MLALRVTYLTGAVRAADVGTGNDKSRPEWPPHPSRVFSALVSAWGASGCRPAARAVLEWLEQQPPPALAASDALPREDVVTFVPANDTPARPRNPRRFPAAVPARESVDLVWADAAPTEVQRRELQSLATLVPSLGHSSSLVWLRLVDEPTEATLHPASEGTLTLRVPTRGRLAKLERLYQEGRLPDQGRWQPYATPDESLPQLATTVFGDMVTYRLSPEGDPIPLAAALRVCTTFRAALMAVADQPVDPVISGHAEASTPASPTPIQRPHLACVPLADVGHRFARSHLMGIAVALPRSLTPGERRACLRALGRLNTLTLGPLGRVSLERLGATAPAHALDDRTWTRPSQVWATVSPIVLDRFPRDPFGHEAGEVVRRSCERVGLPHPVRVELGRVSWVLGAPTADAFPPRRERAGRSRRYHVHARLTFDRPIHGPVLLGAGRYFGYGLCRPVAGAPR